jgi:hypothetical protein
MTARLFLALAVLFAAAGNLYAALPPLLDAALKNFRADPPKGWSFTQTTTAEGKSTVERSDATKAEFERWTLLQKDGRAPTAQEIALYSESRSRRSRAGTAPKLVEQLDFTTLKSVGETADRATFTCGVRPGETSDKTAAFLRASLVVHKASQTLESIELTNVAAFSPTLAVSITEMKTLLTYSLPAGETPSLPQTVSTRVRGRAFWFKSLDADMTVAFSDYVRAGKR